jgi:hypothetical protein
MSVKAPLVAAVLVPSKHKVGKGVMSAPWRVIFANGDIAKAREAAEQWSLLHPGQHAVLVNYFDHVCTVPKAEWTKP